MAENQNQGQGGNQGKQGGQGNERGNQGGQGDTSNRGFASMDEDKQREIASKGGKAAHEQGTAHEFDSEEAREAGRKGGQASGGNKGGNSGGSSEGGGGR
jgi:general stress protein YciG